MKKLSKKKYRDEQREMKRLATIRARKGPNWLRDNAVKAGKRTPTKFNPTTASEAAKKRWASYRARKAQKG